MGSLSLVPTSAWSGDRTDSILGPCSPCETHLARAETVVCVELILYICKPGLRPRL